MTHKFAKAVSKTYAEVGQHHPIRWEVLLKEDDQFVPQTGKIKCKDFFNDLACSMTMGKKFNIYGFSTNDFKVNDDGVWFRLTECHHESFLGNMLDCIIQPMWDQCEIEITCEELPEKGTYLLFLPKAIFANTYLISAVSWLVRAAAYGPRHTAMMDLVMDPIVRSTETSAITLPSQKLLAKWGFVVPKEYGFINTKEKFENIPAYQLPATVHNHGMCAWANNVKDL